MLDQTLPITGEDGERQLFLPGFNRAASAGLFGGVWDDLADAFDRSVDVLVSRLRRKIEGGEGGAAVIKTVRGAGYIFLPVVDRVA